MGKKKTELQMVEESMDRKQSELGSILREAEAEIAIKQRDLREQREELQELDTQKMDVTTTLKNKRAEMAHIKEEVELEDEVLQKLISAVNKQKAELKHVYEMQKLEQNELDTLKVQHSQKLAELEKTQKLLLAEKSDLEQLNIETSRKSSEVDRLRSAVEQDRVEIDRLSQEKQSLEDRISALSREREMLDEGCKSVDNKLNNMKKNQKIMEEKIDHTSRRLEQLEIELRHRDKEMEEANVQKISLQKDIQSLKLTVKDSKSELKALREHIRDAEDILRQQDMDLRETTRQRDEAKLEIDRITEGIRLSQITTEDFERQQEMKREELENLMRNVEKKDIEYQDAKRVLSNVRNEVQREENKLNQLVSSANLELDSIKNDLAVKQEELNQTTKSIENLKHEASRLHATEGTFMDLQQRVRDLEKEIDNKNEEKKELATALTRSYEELQKLRFASDQELEKAAAKIHQMENALHDLQGQLDGKQKDFDNLKKQSSIRLSKLQSLAEEQFVKASCLTEELCELKKEKNNELQQDFHDEMMKTRENEIQQCISSLQCEINRFAPCVENKENLPSYSSNDRVIGGLTEEQDLLRLQLKQQMNRHSEVLQNARLQSEGTIENLKRKLNTLQEVILNSGDSPELRAITERARSRSRSPEKSLSSRSLIHGRGRSSSPGLNRHGYLAQRPRSRSRSSDRILSPVLPEREFLTV